MKSSQIIGMLHIPVNSILASPKEWCEALGLPVGTMEDWEVIDGLRETLDANGEFSGVAEPDWGVSQVERLSFYGFVRDRMLAEAAIYVRNGISTLMLENTGAPYFCRGHQEAVIFWLMRNLAGVLRDAYPKLTLGIQILAFTDNWAMDIACRNRFNFIRCESALFQGIRPEGVTPNHGNLAQLYSHRQELLSAVPRPVVPQVYVDLQKKHTAFWEELSDLKLWLDNIVFMKLEGIVITGTGTGVPVKEEHLAQAREAIEAAKALPYFPKNLRLPLLVGSGVSEKNLAMCSRYADGMIIGSSLKANGYWECELDEERVARFMECLGGK
ncbi:MAG: hypothetical protein J5746_03730 [Victivallales bacterium]|nr:hypothetical protein [Victivallales bacterium]